MTEVRIETKRNKTILIIDGKQIDGAMNIDYIVRIGQAPVLKFELFPEKVIIDSEMIQKE